MREVGRVLVWFSCGAASAVAAKLASEKYPNCELVYCDTLVNEHSDNERFLHDIESRTGKIVTMIGSQKYKSVDEVIQICRYMSGPNGAPCTIELKKVPRFNFQLPGDLHIFGLTADESGRIIKFIQDNKELDFDWILWKKGIQHIDCLDMLKEAGIELPVMYKLGFNNNNCIGCVKASGVAYWTRIRKFFPQVFEKRCSQSRLLGARMLVLKNKRVFLDQLPEDVGLDEDDTEKIECGVMCVSNQVRK